eukprot:COSAG01_NODE_80340_length_121_cov_18.363636_1_plen_24_part_10
MEVASELRGEWLSVASEAVRLFLQ